MSTQTSASRFDSCRSVTRQRVDDGGSTAHQQMETAQNLAICKWRCLSCSGEMFSRTTDVQRLCLLKGVGRLSSVRYRLVLATSNTIMIVYLSISHTSLIHHLVAAAVDNGGSRIRNAFLDRRMCRSRSAGTSAATACPGFPLAEVLHKQNQKRVPRARISIQSGGSKVELKILSHGR